MTIRQHSINTHVHTQTQILCCNAVQKVFNMSNDHMPCIGVAHKYPTEIIIGNDEATVRSLSSQCYKTVVGGGELSYVCMYICICVGEMNESPTIYLNFSASNAIIYANFKRPLHQFSNYPSEIQTTARTQAYAVAYIVCNIQ